jgi:pyruvyltransferase
MISKIKKLPEYVKWLLSKDDSILLAHFTGVANVGDALNVELIQALSGKKVATPPGLRYSTHLLAVGSILQGMNKNSVVWGSGLISAESVHNIRQLGRIMAVRGELTKAIIERHFDIKLDVPLGDPALLMPLVYPPCEKKICKFGLVPHYVDILHPICDVVRHMGGKVLDVSWSPERFISELTACETIISSAMHGLILSDAYGIPSKRITLSDKIHGGDFKFSDYYSTTNSPSESACYVSASVTRQDVDAALSQATVKEIIVDLVSLKNSFPSFL